MYTVYFAGDLFNHKDLVGNSLLAEEINTKSKGRYKCILPQNLEQRNTSAQAIRDQDILSVLNSDLILCNYTTKN